MARHLRPVGSACLTVVLWGSMLTGSLLLGSEPPSNSLHRFLALPPDSTEMRLQVIEEDPATFRAAFDSLLAFSTPPAPDDGRSLQVAAEAYLEATGDSLLLSDLQFARSATPDGLSEWYEAVEKDELGFELRAAQDYEASAAAFEEAATAYQRLGHLRREAVTWGSLGVSVWYTGDLEGVRAAYLNALEARERLGDPVLIGRTLNGLGSVNLKLGDYLTALTFYRRAEEVRRTLNNPTELGATMTYIGHIEFRLGHLDSARVGYLAALDLFGDDAPSRNINEALGGLANVYSNLGEHDKALETYRRIVASAEASGDVRLAALSRSNLGLELSQAGQYVEAIREFELARDAQEAENDQYSLAVTMNQLGGVYRILGDFPRSLEAYQAARVLGEDSGNNLERMFSLMNLGRVYREMSLQQKALEFFEAALALADSMEYPVGVRDALFNKAIVMEEKGEYTRALALYRDCLERDEEMSVPNQAMDHLAIGNALASMAAFDEARRELLLSLQMGRSLDLNAVVSASSLGLADCFEQEGQLDSARVWNGKAIQAIEQIGLGAFSEGTQAAFLGNQSFVYEAQINVLAQLDQRDPGMGYLQEALTTAERGKARAFLDRLAESGFEIDTGADPQLRARRENLERALRSKLYELRAAEDSGASADSIQALRRECMALDRELATLVERIRLENPRLSAVQAATPADLESIRRTLLTGEDRILLEYALGDTASYLWAITAESAALYRLPPREVIENLAREFRDSLFDPALGDTVRLLDRSARLYATILAPAADMLDSKAVVFVVPDGLLHFIPFEALIADPPEPGASSEQSALERCSYVFDDAALHYGPSATSLVALVAFDQSNTAEAPRGLFLGVGDPQFAENSPDSQSVSSLTPLPQSRREVELAASWFPEDRRLLLLGTDASEGRLTAPGVLSGYRVLHFATHGIVDERRPEFSSLALSYPRDGSEDGYLQASEIYGLSLHADLVVLSACETGRGRLVRGEGVLGLPRAFLYAGACRVLVSLWSVSDRSTAALMEYFYEAMVGGKADPGEALREARRHLRQTKGYAHPFFWAPFVLIGPV